MNTSIPKSIVKFFWGDNLEELSWQKNQKYIIQVLLEKGDIESIKWLFSKIDKNNILNILEDIKLTKKSKNFWQIYLK